MPTPRKNLPLVPGPGLVFFLILGACSQSNTGTGGSTEQGGRSSGSSSGASALGGSASGSGGTSATISSSSGGTKDSGGVSSSVSTSSAGAGPGGQGGAAKSSETGTAGAPGSGGTSSALTATGGTRATGGTTAVAGTTTTTSGKGSGGSTGGGGAVGGTNSGSGGGNPGGGAGTSGSTGTGSTSDDATIVPDPSWTCGMPDGIPSPKQGTLAFKATLKIGAIHDVGTTQYGKRRILDITGGEMKGDKVSATVDDLGLDYELTLSNGAMEIEQIMMIHGSDKSVNFLRVCGVAAPGNSLVRVVPDFEAANSGSLAWLNTAKLVGTRTVDASAKTIQIEVYDVSKVTAGGASVKLTDPSGVPNQKWDCVTGSGSKGAEVFKETVLLGSSLSTGASKRGTRNVIPITGGSTTGLVAGAVLRGGADYQLAGNGGTTLDARYNLAPTGDKDFVIVRNCGPMNALIPTFETRADGPYASLNTGTFWSDPPGGATGGVSIVIRERK